MADISLKFVVIMIILLASAAFLFNATSIIVDNSKRSVDKQTCLDSIRLSALTKETGNLVGIKGDPFFSLNCPRQETVVKKKDIVKRSKIDQNTAHNIIAEEARHCWEKVGEGGIDPFSDWNDVEDKSICMICSTLKFDEDLREFMREKSEIKEATGKGNPQDFVITNPLPYLIDTKVPKRDVSYYEFLYNKKPKEELTQVNKEELGKIAIDDGTIVLVRMYKPDQRDYISDEALVITGGIALVVGGIIAAPFTFGGSLGATAAGIATLAGGTVGVLAIGGLAVGGVMTVDFANNAFEDCPDCVGQGSIQIVPPQYDLFAPVIPHKDSDDNIENKALCDILVN